MKLSGVEVWLEDIFPEHIPNLNHDKQLFEGVKIDKKILHSYMYQTNDLYEMIYFCFNGFKYTLVEGVENNQQFNLLDASGCHYLQGFMWPEEKLKYVTGRCLMINILIRESNSLFSHSLQYFLREIFFTRFSQSTNFIYDYRLETIAYADVIVLSLSPGERYTCFPELRAREKGIIIGLINEDNVFETSPKCFADILYIPKHYPLEEIKAKISMIWERWLSSSRFIKCTSCSKCNYRQMSSRQLQIMALYYQGKSAKEIAGELGLCYKSIYSNKYQVMHKYNLHNDNELFSFLNVLAEKNMTTYF